MKLRLAFAFLVFSAFSFTSYGQLAFGVSPGIGLNSAYLGYQVNNKMVPYIGIQYLNGKFDYEESGEEYDWDLERIVDYSHKINVSGSVFIPTLGVKYFVLDQNNLKAFLDLNLSKPFISGKIEYDGEEDDDFKDTIEKMNLLGAEFGFGAEYFFSESFSIGGEFGIRYLRGKFEDSYDTQVYNPQTGGSKDSKIDNIVNANARPAFTKFTLNYYFAGKEQKSEKSL